MKQSDPSDRIWVVVAWKRLINNLYPFHSFIAFKAPPWRKQQQREFKAKVEPDLDLKMSDCVLARRKPYCAENSSSAPQSKNKPPQEAQQCSFQAISKFCRTVRPQSSSQPSIWMNMLSAYENHYNNTNRGQWWLGSIMLASPANKPSSYPVIIRETFSPSHFLRMLSQVACAPSFH